MKARAALVTLFVILTVLPLIRVASTYHVFSQTADEPVHVAAGFQWLTSDNYDLDPEHPPLARIGFATQPFLTGAHVTSDADRTAQGNQILYRNDRYSHNLAFVRAPNLLFLALAIVVIALWSKSVFDTSTAVVAVALFGSGPAILAHAGLATTDMAVTAMTAVAGFVFWQWMKEPRWRNAALLGVAIGFGLASKFSFPVFFLCSALPIALASTRSNRGIRLSGYAQQLLVILAVALFIIWGMYKFSYGTLRDARLKVFPDGAGEFVAAKYSKVPGYAWVRTDLLYRFYSYSHLAESRGITNVDFVDWAKAAGYPSPLAGRRGNTMVGAPPIPRPGLVDLALAPVRAAWQWVGVNVSVPAPLFIVGAEYVGRHSRMGHPAYLLGQYSNTGWWYYFPVVLFFKTPLPFLLLSVIGIFVMLRTRNPGTAIAIIPIVSLLAAMTSSINIGVRHILPLYPFLAIAGGVAVVALWRIQARRRAFRTLVVVLLIWQFGGTAMAHPDYLAWFNECAGSHPERIAVDSNLDWGQDVLRLVRVVRDRRISQLYVAYFGSADWKRHLPQGRQLPASTHVQGWVAISQMRLKFDGTTTRDDGFQWLQSYSPVRKVGKSIRLYFIP